MFRKIAIAKESTSPGPSEVATASKRVHRRRSWRVGAGVLILVAAAFLLRVYHVAADDITIDEDLNLCAVQQPLLQVPSFVAPRPPLAFLAQKIVTIAAGHADLLAIRLASVIEGVAAVFLLFVLAYRIAGLRVAFVSATLLCFSHYHFIYCREARYYPLLVLSCLFFFLCYWEAFTMRRLALLPLLFIAAVMIVATHLAGAVFLALCAAAVPVFLCSGQWWVLVRKRPYTTAGAFAAALMLAAAALFLLRSHVAAALRMVSQGYHAPKATPGFDVAPGFLLDLGADYTGVPQPMMWSALVLALLGLGWAFLRKPRFAVTAVLVIAGPFLCFHLLNPQSVTAWRSRYVIYILPFLLLLEAMGIDALVALFEKALRGTPLTDRGQRRVLGTVAAVLIALLCVPNAGLMLRDYRYPKTGVQEAARFLTASVQPGDRLIYTQWYPAYYRHDVDAHWDLWRSLRHYYSTEATGASVMLAKNARQLNWSLEQANAIWRLHSGNWTSTAEIADFIYSNKFSRMAFEGLLVAFGPSIQEIRFGENYPGTPSTNPSLDISPGKTASIDILVPRAGERVLLLQPAPGGGAPAPVSVGVGERPALVAERYDGAYRTTVTLDSGRTIITVGNPWAGKELVLESVSLLPCLNAAPLTIPAWDFHEIQFGANKHAIYFERLGETICIRNMRGKPRLMYRFFSECDRQVRVRLSALNDPSLSNTYEISVLGGDNQPCRLDFDLESNSLSTLETTPQSVLAGVNTLCVQYIHPAEKEREMRGPRLKSTPRRLQQNGLAAVEIVPCCD